MGKQIKTIIPFYKNLIIKQDYEAVSKVLDSGCLTTGKVVADFTFKFQDLAGAKYAIPTNSATAAALIGIQALDLKPESEIIIPTITFSSSAMMAYHLGYKIVFVDVEPLTLNVDLEKINDVITKNTSAIIFTHVGGYPADVEGLKFIAKRHKLKLIEDATQALPTYTKQYIVGEDPDIDITFFSFNAASPLSCGEGGMLTTHKVKVINKAKKLLMPETTKEQDIVLAGWGGSSMTDLHAALGINQINQQHLYHRTRQSIFLRYSDKLQNRVQIPKFLNDHSCHSYTIQINNRNELSKIFKEEGIGHLVAFKPLHMYSFWQKYITQTHQPTRFVNSETAYNKILSLPIYCSLSYKNQMKVIDVVCRNAE